MNNRKVANFSLFSLTLALTTVPGIAAHAQLLATSDSSTYRLPNIHEGKTAPVGAPLVSASTQQIEGGGDGQSAMRVAPSAANQGSIGGNAHACAGTGDPDLPASGATSSCRGEFSTFLFLSSATLPEGTPVDVEFKYKAKVDAHTNTDPVYDYLTVIGNCSISALAQGQSASTTGSYAFQSVLGGGLRPPRTLGLFAAEDGVTFRLTGIPVGSRISFAAEMDLLTGANAYGYYYNAADISAGLVWGADALNAEAILTYGPENSLFPSRSTVNDPNLDAAIPAFQFPPTHGNLTAAPEPPALVLLLTGILPFFRRGRSAVSLSGKSQTIRGFQEKK